MKLLSLLLCMAAAANAADTLDVFGMKWTVPAGSEWKVEDGVLQILQNRGPLTPRRPQQFALSDKSYDSFTLEADVKALKRSLIIVYAYKDNIHFDYAHLSSDTAAKQTVHNGVFHVFGGERVRISSEEGPASFPSIDDWYHVVMKYDSKSGRMDVLVNGKPNPSLQAVDLSLKSGKVGLGSFDETAMFKNVKITAHK